MRSSVVLTAASFLCAAVPAAKAETWAFGMGPGIGVAADGKNDGVGYGLLVLAERPVLSRGALTAQASAGALWTFTAPASCGVVVNDRCHVAAKLAFAGLHGRLSLPIAFLDLGLGLGFGSATTRGGASSSSEAHGLLPLLRAGFGLPLPLGVQLSLQYLYLPRANQLTGGLALMFGGETLTALGL